MLAKIYHYLDRIYYNKNFLLVYRCCKVLINIFIPLSYMFTRRKKCNSQSNIIISLTSFPARIGKVHLVIESLLRQTYMPQKIVLYLSRMQFNSMDQIPRRLKKLCNNGYMEISFVDDDLKSHKKYYYAVKEYEGYDIITVDDDIFYPEDLVECLHKGSVDNRDTVVCLWANSIKLKENKLCSYEEWSIEDVVYDKPQMALLPIGCAGIYYPYNSFNVKLLLDKERILELCPKADDIWLRFNTLLNGKRVVKTGYYMNFVFIDVLIRNNISLCKENVSGGQNDVQIANIVEVFPSVLKALLESGEVNERS